MNLQKGPNFLLEMKASLNMLPEVPRNFRNMKDVSAYLFSPIVHFSSPGNIFWHPLGSYFRNTDSKYFAYCGLGFKGDFDSCFTFLKLVQFIDYWGKILVCLNYTDTQQCLWTLVLSYSDQSFWNKNQDMWLDNRGYI